MKRGGDSHLRLPPHVEMTLMDLALYVPLTKAEIIRQAILTFAQAVQREDDSYSYVRSFLELEKGRVHNG